MYRLPFADGSFDLAVMEMVLHYAEDPPGVLTEAARVLRPGGQLIIIDLARHDRQDLLTRLAHRWPGFGDDAMRALLAETGLQHGPPLTIDGPLAIRLWPATRAADAASARPREMVV
jgi:ArsR family transcriptional regulator